LFWNCTSLCNSGWPWTHYIAQASLKLMTLLPCLPSTGMISMYHHSWSNLVFLELTLGERNMVASQLADRYWRPKGNFSVVVHCYWGAASSSGVTVLCRRTEHSLSLRSRWKNARTMILEQKKKKTLGCSF
jgi:hypothetical protein